MTQTTYEQIQAVNWSTLKNMLISPRMLQFRRAHPQPDSPALQLGRAVHCALLEPAKFGCSFAMAPDVDRRTKIGKKAYSEFAAQVGERTLLTAEQYDAAHRMAAAVRKHRLAELVLRGVRAEEAVTWTDRETGLPCKARLDAIGPMALVEVKSTRRATLAEMSRDAGALAYHGQIAWYHYGAIEAGALPPDARQPWLIMTQSSEPYDVAIGTVSTSMLERGRKLCRDLLTQYATCEAAGIWPGIAPDEVLWDVPGWAPGGEDEPTGEVW